MNCSTGAVKQLTVRALSALRELLALEEAL
jgi:hypothetical protein